MAVHHFEFTIILILVISPSLKSKSAAAHQISLKSDDPQLKYSDETIFKMAAVRHVELSKIFKSIALCLNMIVLQRTKFRVNRAINRGDSQNTIFNIRHIGFVVTSSYCIWEHYFNGSLYLLLKPKFETLVWDQKTGLRQKVKWRWVSVSDYLRPNFVLKLKSQTKVWSDTKLNLSSSILQCI